MAAENTYITQIKNSLKISGKPLQDSFFNQLNQQILTIPVTDNDLTTLATNLITYLDTRIRKGTPQQQLIIDILGKIGRRVQNSVTIDTILSILNRKLAHPELIKNIVQAFELVSLNPVLKTDRNLSGHLLTFLLQILEDPEYKPDVKENAAKILENINSNFIGIDTLGRLIKIKKSTSSDSTTTTSSHVGNVIKIALKDNESLKNFFKHDLEDSPSFSFKQAARRTFYAASLNARSLPIKDLGNHSQSILTILFFLLLL
jgi:hypothetical protein